MDIEIGTGQLLYRCIRAFESGLSSVSTLVTQMCVWVVGLVTITFSEWYVSMYGLSVNMSSVIWQTLP